MKSANQLYKESGSDLPFKEWLQTQQQRGRLANHREQKLNADGTQVTIAGVDVKTILLISALAVVGVYIYKSRK
jgi:hypothetical protein